MKNKSILLSLKDLPHPDITQFSRLLIALHSHNIQGKEKEKDVAIKMKNQDQL